MPRLAIGENIQEARIHRYMSQEELAEKLGVARETVRNWERDTRGIKADQLVEIALVLDVPSDFLLGLSESMSKDKDIQAASGTTGLSDSAIEALQGIAFDDGWDETDNLKICSGILESRHFPALVRSIADVVNAARNLQGLDTLSNIEYCSRFPDMIKQAKYSIYDATDFFRHVLNDIVLDCTNHKISIDKAIVEAEQTYDRKRRELPDGVREGLEYGEHQ